MKVLKTRHALLVSVLSLVLCLTMLTSTTFAWFTDTAVSGNNIIKSGNLDMKLSYKPYGANNTDWTEVDEDTVVFGKDAKYEPGYTEAVWLKVENLGSLAFRYAIELNVSGEKTGINKDGKEFKLSDYLEVRYMNTTSTDMEKNFYTTRESLDSFNWGGVANSGVATLADDIAVIETGVAFAKNDPNMAGFDCSYVLVVISMPTTVGNEANHNGVKIPEINFTLTALATQLAHENDSFNNQYDKDSEYPVINTVDTWDGTADFAFFGLRGLSAEATTDDIADAIKEAKDNNTYPTDEEIVIGSAEELAAFAKLVDAGETFEGKTVKLGKSVDLAGILFDPIGSYRNDKAFKGTFDGQGHTISNLSQNTWELNNGYYYGDLGLGLFGLVEDATIINLNMDGASISGESAICGIVAATAYGDCRFENITVTNSKANDYQYYAGGVVGWASGNHTYKKINMDASTTIGSQWGDFGNANGGIIGGAGTSGTYHFEDCTVACRIDAVNDVVSAYQWYNYRNSGMLIGKVGPAEIVQECTNVTANNVTCKNVTVIYGDWANYTYCEFAGTGYPYVRVQAGVSVDAYSNVRYGHPTDANGNTVVDDNHVHNDGEAHHELIAFDNLFGGPANARYCYYGIPEFDGVNVVYNNK